MTVRDRGIARCCRRTRRTLSVVLLATACGRSPLVSRPTLIVHVVDELGDGVGAADVELHGTADDDELVTDYARTDAEGLAVFEFPGPGRYELHATTDPICCWREGTLPVRITGTDALLVVHTRTGPCPTAIPVWCS